MSSTHDAADRRHRPRRRILTDLGDSLTSKSDRLFALSGLNGDLDCRVNTSWGLYYHDTRFLDVATLRLDDRPLSVLLSHADGNRIVCELTNPNTHLHSHHLLPEGRLGIRRERLLTTDEKIEASSPSDRNSAPEQASRADRAVAIETVEVTNFSTEANQVDLDFEFAAGFEDMFVVRGSEQGRRGELHPPRWSDRTLEFRYDGADRRRRTTRITFDPPPSRREAGEAHFTLDVAAGERALVRIEMRLSDVGEGDPLPRASKAHDCLGSVVVETDNPLFDRVLERSFGDLRMLLTEALGQTYFAAGVPWFVALFGRDSLVSSLQTMAFDPGIAAHTLILLAEHQGRRSDDWRDEQPGKILHELRVGEMANLHEVPQTPYYGSIDVTPLYVILAAEYLRWTDDRRLLKRLRPSLTAALEWMDGFADSDGDGFTDYATRSAKGFRNQGWKDSGNSIVNRDGSLAEPPIALVEVQGYVHRAKLGAAFIQRLMGDEEHAQRLESEADGLRAHFTKAFWMADRRYLALALEQGGRRVDSITSNPGQALWGGIVDPEQARDIAETLMSEGMFSGWGIRTLAQDEAAYNPIDYQVGSVWPHDNSLIAEGLKAYGFDEAALRVFTAIFEAAAVHPGFRLPELFAGFPRAQYPVPVRYPVACNPQAWAAGALPHLLTTALGLHPDAPGRQLQIRRPRLPPWLGEVNLRHLRVGRAEVDLRYQRSGPDTMVAVRHTRGELDVHISY